MFEVSLCIEAYQFASGSETGIKRHYFLEPSGEASSNWRRFSANTLMASSSAALLACSLNSFSMEDFNRRS